MTRRSRPRADSGPRLPRRSGAEAGPRSGSLQFPNDQTEHTHATVPRILFITGTDTGVGKTLLTALLLAHLRNSHVHALAIKPFCSGDREDAKLLHSLQDGQLSLEEINPFYFPEPLAPLVAARKHHRRITLEDTINHITGIAARLTPSLRHSNSGFRNPQSAIRNPPALLIEGVGGLLVPLGDYYTVLDLISRLDCEIIIVARNQLGTITLTLLTVHALRNAARWAHSPIRAPHSAIKVALMHTQSAIRNPQFPDPSSSSNPRILSELLAPLPLVQIPFLSGNPKNRARILENARRLKSQLAQLCLRPIYANLVNTPILSITSDC